MMRDQLSSAELLYLDGISKGMTAKEIGAALNKSTRTVENWAAKTYEKLSAKSAAHAVGIAYRLKLLPI